MSIPQELLQRFLAGADTRLHEIGELVATLPTAADDEQLIRKLARALHTFKGEGRLLGLEEITKLCHAGEEVLFSHQKAGQIGKATELALYETIDTIFACIQARRDGETFAEDDITSVLESLQAAAVQAGTEALSEAADVAGKPAASSGNGEGQEAATPAPPDETTATQAREPQTEEPEAAESGDAPREGGARSVHLSSQAIDTLTN